MKLIKLDFSSISQLEAVRSIFVTTDTIYEINENIDLEGTRLIIPSNCILKFSGGSFSNGILEGQRTAIEANLQLIFDERIVIEGTWLVNWAYPEWFGALGDDSHDDTVAIQKALDFFNNVILGNRSYLCNGTLLLNENTSIVGTNKRTSVIHKIVDSQAILLMGATISNISIDIDVYYNNSAILVHTTVISQGRERETIAGSNIIEDVIIRMMIPPLADYNAATSNGIGIYLLDDNAGIYNMRVNRVDIYRAKEALRLEVLPDSSNSISWINNNYFELIKAYACVTALKIVISGIKSEVRGNYFKITYQNDVNFPTVGKVFDIPITTRCANNIIESIIWDLDEKLEKGSLLGNAGMNRVIDINSSCWMNFGGAQKFYCIGTIPANPGWGCVDIEFNNFSTKKEKMRLSYYENSLHCAYREFPYPPLIDEVKYKIINNIIYIYVHSDFNGYVRALYSNESCFTPSFLMPYMNLQGRTDFFDVNLNEWLRYPVYSPNQS